MASRLVDEEAGEDSDEEEREAADSSDEEEPSDDEEQLKKAGAGWLVDEEESDDDEAAGAGAAQEDPAEKGSKKKKKRRRNKHDLQLDEEDLDLLEENTVRPVLSAMSQLLWALLQKRCRVSAGDRVADAASPLHRFACRMPTCLEWLPSSHCVADVHVLYPTTCVPLLLR